MHMYLYICIYTYIYKYIYIYMYTYIYKCGRVYRHVHIYMCIKTSIYIYILTHTHKHTQTHTKNRMSSSPTPEIAAAILAISCIFIHCARIHTLVYLFLYFINIHVYSCISIRYAFKQLLANLISQEHLLAMSAIFCISLKCTHIHFLYL